MLLQVEEVRAERRREAKERARKAYQKRATLPGYEEDRLGDALRAHMPLDAVTVAWLRDDARRLRAVEIHAEDAKQQAPSLRALRLPSLREVRAAA